MVHSIWLLIASFVIAPRVTSFPEPGICCVWLFSRQRRVGLAIEQRDRWRPWSFDWIPHLCLLDLGVHFASLRFSECGSSSVVVPTAPEASSNAASASPSPSASSSASACVPPPSRSCCDNSDVEKSKNVDQLHIRIAFLLDCPLFFQCVRLLSMLLTSCCVLTRFFQLGNVAQRSSSGDSFAAVAGGMLRPLLVTPSRARARLGCMHRAGRARCDQILAASQRFVAAFFGARPISLPTAVADSCGARSWMKLCPHRDLTRDKRLCLFARQKLEKKDGNWCDAEHNSDTNSECTRHSAKSFITQMNLEGEKARKRWNAPARSKHARKLHLEPQRSGRRARPRRTKSLTHPSMRSAMNGPKQSTSFCVKVEREQPRQLLL